MSGLFNQQTSQIEVFNDYDFLKSLCADTKIEISEYADIQFLKGWAGIVKEFINSVKNYPVRVNQISDYYSLIYIKFEVIKATKEVCVWRAIDVARNHSLSICANCGEDKGFRRKHSIYSMLCEKCTKNANLIGKTGTWLDKF